MRCFVVSAVVLFSILHAEGFVSKVDKNPRTIKPNGGEHDGSILVTGGNNGGRPQVHTNGNYGYKNGNFELNLEGTHSAGRGRKPGYEGMLTGTYRWRRDVTERRQPSHFGIPNIYVFPSPSPTIPEPPKERFVRDVSDDIQEDGNEAETEVRQRRSLRSERWRPGRPNEDIFPKPSPTFPERPRDRYIRDVIDEEMLENENPQDSAEFENRGKRSLRDNWRPYPDRFPRPSPTFPRPSPTFPERRYVRDVAPEDEEVEDNSEALSEPDIREKRSFGTGHSTGGRKGGQNNGGQSNGNKGGKKGSSGGIGNGNGDRRLARSAEEFEVDEGLRLKRSPKDRGTWDVSVNKDKGRGPQVRTEGQGNIYTSKNGNWKVDAQGHHEFGKGRKPDYGGGVKVTGRWRREIDDEAMEQPERQKRSPEDRGTWDVSVNKDKGSGPQVHTQGQGNIYTSKDGNIRVDAQGHHEFGKGRKPDYGGGIKVSGRWRRDIAEEQQEEQEEEAVRNKRSFAPGASFPSGSRPSSQQGDRGSWGVSVNKDKGRGPQIRTEGQGNVYTGKDGRTKIDAHGHHEFGKGRKPSFGGGVSGRWRRAADDEEVEEDEVERVRREANPQRRGSVGVTLDHQHGRGPMVRTDANYNLYSSRNGNWQFNANGFHEAGRGMKPNYGAGLTLTGRFRREVEACEDEENSRVRREANPQQKGERGSVSVSVNKDKGRGPQIRTDVQRNIYTSRDKSFRVDGSGYHEAGRGRKPDYGGRISLTKSF